METSWIFPMFGGGNHQQSSNDSQNYMTFVLYAFIVLLGTITLSSKRGNKKVSNGSAKLPSLPSLPIIGPLHKLLLSTDPAKVYLSWYAKYGTSFRTKLFGQEFVVLNNPAWVKKLLGSSEPGHMKKHKFLYDLMFPGLGGGLTAISNIPEWKKQRHILAKVFTLASLKEYMLLFNHHAREMVVDLGDPKNSLHDMIHMYTFKMISEISVGVDVLTEEDTMEMIEHYRKCQELISFRGYNPWCMSETIWNLHPKKKEMDYSSKVIMSKFAKFVSNARERLQYETLGKEQNVKSVRDLLLGADENLTDEAIYAEMANTISAGHETTSVTLEYFMLNMALHPHHQDECRKEIDQIFDTLEAGTDDGNITLDKLSKLDYMERCLKESMRLFTTAPIIMRELSSPLQLEDDLVLQEGTAIVVSPMTIHRDATIYPEPHKYDPDRFLLENCTKRSVYAFLPFSQGPRNCVGFRMATEEMKLITSYILRHYTLHTTNTQEELENALCKKLFPPPDLRVECRKRQM